jgi:hypothetical protein
VLVGWLRDTPQKDDVLIRTFDPMGAPLGAAQSLVPDGSLGGSVRVAGSSAGGFAVAWLEEPLATFANTILVQRVDANGNPAGGRVTVASDAGGKVVSEPRVVLDGQGRIVVMWLETPSVGGISRVLMRKFNVDNTPNGSIVVVSSEADRRALALAADDLGRVVAVVTEEIAGTSTNRNVARRYNQSLAAVGAAIFGPAQPLQGAVNDRASVVMTPDTGEFLLLRTEASHFYVTGYSANGVVLPDDPGLSQSDIRLDARDEGFRSSPAMARLPGGELMAAWSSATMTSNRSEIRVTAEAFDSNLVPIDIDFDAGLSRRAAIPLGDQGSDPVPSVAAAGDRFAIAWEAPGGVRLQLFRRGPYACPSDADCRQSVPIMVNGLADASYNLMLVRGQNLNDTTILNRIGPRTFVRNQAVQFMVNAQLTVDSVEQNRGKFNVFYMTTPTEVHTTGFKDPDTIGMARILNAGQARPGGSEFTYNALDLGQFRHESGHAIWALSDEYSCSVPGTTRIQPNVHGNIFLGKDVCEALSVNPTACKLLDAAPDSCEPKGPWAKSDPDEDIMTTSRGPALYGPDCLAEIEVVLTRIPCTGGSIVVGMPTTTGCR